MTPPLVRFSLPSSALLAGTYNFEVPFRFKSENLISKANVHEEYRDGA